jgi:hypothetical protein
MIDGATGRRWIGGFALVGLALWIASGVATAESFRSLAPLGYEASASRRVLFQGEWAANLALALGLASTLPEDSNGEEVFGLLCPEGAERRIGAGGLRLPAESAFRVSVDAPRRRSPVDPVRVMISVPATAVYMLSVEGTGPQRWSIDQRPVGHLDASALGVAQAPAVVALRHGPHELTGYLTHSSRVDRVELSAYRPLCIAPANGWRFDRPLTYAGKARTLVRALAIEQRLPVSGDPILVEGEYFIDVSAWGGHTNRQLVTPASAGVWATAAGSPAEFSYRIHIDEPAVFSIQARLHGQGPQLWSVDGRHRVTVTPGEGSEDFVWTDVTTLQLTTGEHVIRALLPQDDGIDVFRLVRRRSRDTDYLTLIEEAGFRGGAPAAYVTRAAAFASLSNPTFSEHAQHFLAHLVAGNAPVFLVENDLDSLYSRPLSPLLPPEL